MGQICEAGLAGSGASCRNAGMLGPSFHRLGVQGLVAHYGAERAAAIFKESAAFVDFIETFINREKIDCDFVRNGRVQCASLPKHYDRLIGELDSLVEATGIRAEAVSREQLKDEIGSEALYGGVRYQDDACLHPAKYLDGLLSRVMTAGAVVSDNNRVLSINKTGNQFKVTTALGDVTADKLVITSNAYTGSESPWFQRRVMPIRTSMIATEELDSELMQRLMPTGRCYGDSRRIMTYYRPSPDGKRILFGGRATSADAPEKNALLLKRSLVKLFPELRETRISHSWSGLVAYSFDHVPHLGEHEGMYYAMGYCGSGVARASLFGTRLGQRILGNAEEGKTAFDGLPFQTYPFYRGKPWFLPAVFRWHRIMDAMGL